MLSVTFTANSMGVARVHLAKHDITGAQLWDDVELVNGATAVKIVRPAYYPYGQEMGSVTANDTAKFGTYTRDGATGLDYAMNRYYQSTWGRFTSPDPYRASGGPGDPGSWNRYSYVQGDPVNALHPDGLQLRMVSVRRKVCFYVMGSLDSCEYFDDTYWVDDGLGGGGSSNAGPDDVPGGGGGSGNTTSSGGKRPEWLNTFASILGYDENVPLPSCFGIFLQSFWENMKPIAPGPGLGTGFGSIADQMYDIFTWNKAMDYATNTPSRTFGTSSLMYPQKSSVFRSLVNQASKGFWVGLLTDVVIAEFRAGWTEWQAIRAGQCQ
jgi:RHS repeat-associated protein